MGHMLLSFDLHTYLPLSHTHTMHQTFPVAPHPPPPSTVAGVGGGPIGGVVKTVSESAVTVIGTRGCCMCHVVQKLLQSLGVNPPVYEVDEQHVDEVAAELSQKFVRGGGGGDVGDNDGEIVQFPAVFVGGKLFGGLERVMATHISGELVPILKNAGALWL